MKRIFKWLPALLAFAALSVACKTDDPTPAPGPEEEPWVQEQKVEAQTSEGASIEFVSVDLQKFEWTITPNPDCLAYRVEVIMKDRALNLLWEAQKTDPSLTFEGWAEQTMFATDGSGAPSWTGAVDGVGEPRDFSSDMTIFQGYVFPDTEYYIMVWGCLSADGNSPSEFTCMTVKTNDPGELIGNPEVELQHECTYRFTQTTAIPNEDCAYFNVMVLPQADVDEYLAQEQFSEATLLNVISSFSIAPETEAVQTTALDWGFNADPTHVIGAVAVARDGNLKPNPKLFYDQYTVLEKDPTAELPSYTYTFKRNSAYAVEFRVEYDPETTSNAYYSIQPNSSGTPKDAADMIQNGGWVVGPEEFDQFQYVSPDTHYEIWLTARNYQSDILEMEKLDLCDTKSVGTFDVDASNFKSELTSVSKTQATVSFEPTDEISCWFFLALAKGEVYYDPVTGESTGLDVTDPANKEKARVYLMNNGNIFTQNTSWIVEDDWNHFTYTGMEPGKEYVHMCLAETWDGNFVDVQYVPITTSDNTGGDDPQITFDMDQSIVDAENLTWQVRFSPNDHVTQMYYCICSETEACALLDQGVDAPMDQKYTAWSEYVLGEAGMNNAGVAITLGPTAIYDNMLALAIGYGAVNPDTNERYLSPLAVLRLNLETMQMEDISQEAQSDETKAAVAAMMAKARAAIQSKPVKPLSGHTASGKEYPGLLIRTK